MVEISDPVEANQVAWHRLKMSLPGHQVYDEPFALWSTRSRPAGSAIVTRARLSGDLEECQSQIEKIHRTYQDANCHANWFWGPEGTPGDFAKRLRRLHLMGPQYSPSMILNLSKANLVNPKLKCELVTDWAEFEREKLPLAEWYPKAEKADAVQMLMEATSKSPEQAMHFVCRMEGKAVCSTTLYFFDDTVGIYDVVTLPEHRGKGAGTSLMHFAFQFAFERGAKFAVLQSYHKATAWYESLGFEKIGRYSGMYYSMERLRNDRNVRLTIPT